MGFMFCMEKYKKWSFGFVDFLTNFQSFNLWPRDAYMDDGHEVFQTKVLLIHFGVGLVDHWVNIEKQLILVSWQSVPDMNFCLSGSEIACLE